MKTTRRDNPRLSPQLLIIIAAQFLLAALVQAAPVKVGPVVIAIPDGFQVAQTQRVKRTLVTAWTKSVRNGSLKTLLQIDVVDVGSSAEKSILSETELTVGAERYLRQFLAGIERRRANYASSPVAHITLAGIPGVRATWNGTLGGLPVVGVMYSVIVRNRFVVVLHTQDLGSAPSEGMFEAMRAIEGMALVDAAAHDPA